MSKVSKAPIVAVAQTSPVVGEVEVNLTQAEQVMSSLEGNADLVVFPELFTTGYRREGFDHRAYAEAIPGGHSLQRLAKAAARSRLSMIGTILEDAEGKIFDTAVVIDADGNLVGRYRKTHLYPSESAHFGAGSELIMVEIGNQLRLGLAICFEHAFPEIFTKLALAGANVVAIPSAVPRDFEYLLKLRTRARAQDNQIFVAASNLVGFDGETYWCGESMIVDPRGDILAEAGSDHATVITAPLDLARIDGERRQEPVLSNRRPELYQHLPSRAHNLP